MTKVERPFTHAVCGTHAISLKGPVILRPRGADHPACMPPIMLTVQPARRPRVAPHAENSVRVLVSSQAPSPRAACRAQRPARALRVEPSAQPARRASSRARGPRVACHAERVVHAPRVMLSAWSIRRVSSPAPSPRVACRAERVVHASGVELSAQPARCVSSRAPGHRGPSTTVMSAKDLPSDSFV